MDGAIVPSTMEYFWNTNTKNNLYGFQIGADANIWEWGCFSIDGLVKAGVFCNHAEQTSTIIDTQITSSGSSSTNHTAFLGEIGLQCKYQVTCNLTLRAGYEALWIQGVALAPGQIQESNFATEQFGINTNSGVFYHGATAGFEYNF
jgi:opacity protein-like surface antigen